LPSRIAQFLEGATQRTTGPSLEEQHVRGMQQVLMDKLSFCKKNTEACVHDEAKHAVVKGR